MIEYWKLFLLFGFLGWIIDTTYRSYIDGRYAPGTWLPYFGLIYAIATPLIVAVFRHVPVHAVLQVVIATMLGVLIELISGILVLAVLKRRLWDYRAHRYNFLGYIELRHTLYWLFLITCIRLAYHFTPF